MNEMNRSLEQILTQYTQYVKPAFEEFCLPVSTLLLWWCKDDVRRGQRALEFPYWFGKIWFDH